MVAYLQLVFRPLQLLLGKMNKVMLPGLPWVECKNNMCCEDGERIRLIEMYWFCVGRTIINHTREI